MIEWQEKTLNEAGIGLNRTSEAFGGSIRVGGIEDRLEQLVDRAKQLGYDAGARTDGNRRKRAWITANQGSDPLRFSAVEKPTGSWLISISGSFLVASNGAAERYSAFFADLAKALVVSRGPV